MGAVRDARDRKAVREKFALSAVITDLSPAQEVTQICQHVVAILLRIHPISSGPMAMAFAINHFIHLACFPHACSNVKDASGRRRKVPIGWTELQCCYQDGSVEQVWLKLVPENFNCRRDNKGWRLDLDVDSDPEAPAELLECDVSSGSGSGSSSASGSGSDDEIDSGSDSSSSDSDSDSGSDSESDSYSDNDV